MGGSGRVPLRDFLGGCGGYAIKRDQQWGRTGRRYSDTHRFMAQGLHPGVRVPIPARAFRYKSKYCEMN